MDKKTFLKSIEIFKNFSDAAITKLTETVKEKTCKTGEKIFSEGDPGEHLYIIADGEVIISKKIPPETEKILAVLGPKSVFGETSLFSDANRTADAKAKTDLKYYSADRCAIQKVFSLDSAGTRKTLESFLFSTLERLEQTSRELATIYEISKIIAENLEFKEFSRKVLKQIFYSVPNVDSGTMYIWNEFADEYELVASNNPIENQANIQNTHPLVKFLLTNKSETSIIENNDTILQTLDNIYRENICSVIITPLCKEDSLLGFILFLSKTKTIKYGSRMRDLMNSISTQLVSTIVNIRNKEEERARERLRQAREGSVGL
jgi:CRP-like cAMP-binding protein